MGNVAAASTLRPIVAAAALVLAAGGCAELLGLDDPAGRLGEGGAGAAGAQGTGTGPIGTGGDSSTGTGQGGGPGVGGGASTSSSTGSGSSTGAGGAAADRGFVELPADFQLGVLGPSDDGAVALVRWSGGSNTQLCGADVAPGELAAVAMEGAGCTALTTLSGNTPGGVAIEQRGPWLGIVANANAGTFSMSTQGSSMSVELGAGGVGVFALWEVGTIESGILVGTTSALHGGRLVPRGDGTAQVVHETLKFGFTGDSDCASAGAPTRFSQVYFSTLGPAAESCASARPEVQGTLREVAEGDVAWAVIESGGTCHAYPMDGTASLPLGSCPGPVHLLAVPDDGPDDLYLGTTASGLCSMEAGLIANLTGQAQALWCADPVAPTPEDVIPFHVDATHVHFVVVTQTESQLWKVPVDGGVAEEPQRVCTSCAIRDAITSKGAVYLAGKGFLEPEVLDEPIADAAHFWAWIPLADL